jgi:hypothetical protein
MKSFILYVHGMSWLRDNVEYRSVATQRSRNRQRDNSSCCAMIVRWGDYIRPVSGQRLGKHVPAATVKHAKGETGCCLRGPRRDVIKNWGNRVELIVAGSSVLES